MDKKWNQRLFFPNWVLQSCNNKTILINQVKNGPNGCQIYSPLLLRLLFKKNFLKLMILSGSVSFCGIIEYFFNQLKLNSILLSVVPPCKNSSSFWIKIIEHHVLMDVKMWRCIYWDVKSFHFTIQPFKILWKKYWAGVVSRPATHCSPHLGRL